MSTYKEIFGKAIKSITGDPNPSPITYTVTVANPGSGNKYYIDGVLTPTLELYEGNTYNFDYSGASSHPFRFSTTSDGTHSGGIEYLDGISVAGNVTTIIVQPGAPTLYYYCSSHSGMGGTALTPAANSTLEGQIWYNETLGKFRSVVMSGAFSSGGSLNVGRYAIGSAGTFTAGLAIGGDLFPNPPGRGSNSSEEYNGTSWATGGNLGTSASWRAGAGTQTAASGTAGNNYSTYISTSENYDGSSWTSAPSAPYAAEGSVSTGSRPASIWGGGGDTSSAYPNTFFYGDGEGWTAISSANNPNRYASVFTGTQTAALITGGSSPQTANTESWNGSSWSNETAFPRVLANGGGNRVGTSTSGVVAGGTSTALPGQNLTSTHWDGTAWAADAALSVLKQSSTSAGTQSQYYVAGAPNPGSAPGRASTEEYEKTIYTVTSAAWASGGNLNTARDEGASSQNGSQTAALYFGGYVSDPASNATEQYDGSSWTSKNNLNTARYSGAGAGTTTAALYSGGFSNPSTLQSAVEEWDGTNWTTQPNSLSTARVNPGGCGIQTAALVFGGVSPSPGDPLTSTEEYDGSSWTNGGALPAGQSHFAGYFGTQTAAVGAGGNSPSSTYITTTVEYGGTSWTAGGALITGTRVGAGAGIQTNGIVFGGATAPGAPNYTGITQGYDGSAFSTRPSMGTARVYPSGTGSATAGLAFGGNAPPYTTATEEFSGAVTRLDYKSISSS